MRILLIGTAYPFRGGIAHYLALLFQALRRRGHRVKILSFTRQYPSLFFPGKTQQDCSQEAIPVEAEAILDSMNPVSWIRTARRVQRERCHLVVFKYWMPFFAPCYAAVAFLSKLLTPTRVLFICDNITPHERRFGDDLLNALALRWVDYFIVQSNVVREDLLRFRPRAKYRQVPHPVYEIFRGEMSRGEARKRLGLGEEEKVVLFFGYVRAYKGLNYLIDAVPKILQTMPVKVLVVGEFYDDRGPYENQIARLGVQSVVRISDRYVPNEEVGLYFSAADVVVLPYVSATQSGIVQIAYNYDRPVITTDVGGLPEVVVEGRTGYVVPARDPEALAAAVVRFFSEGRAAEFAENIHREKEKYSWDRLVEAIEALAEGSSPKRGR